MRYIDLFAGVGGFRYGIEAAWKHLQKQGAEWKRIQPNGDKSNPQKRSGSGGERNRELQLSENTCVYSNEYDKYANSVYRRHYGKCDQRDIRTVKAEEIPDHDLLCGGFPCQAFSVAGKRGGFEDTRGTLFFEIARILQQKQPPYLLLENVKGLLSHENGRTFQVMLAALDELGYDCQWQVLNSKDFFVPQNRERVFIIGHLRGEPRPEVFPIRETNSQNLRELTTGESQGMRIYSPDGVSTTLAGNAGGWGGKTGLYAVGGSQKNAAVMKERSPALTEAMGKGGGHTPVVVPVLTPDRAKKRQNGRRMKTNGEPSFTLTKQDQHEIFNGAKIRRLTPTECERLQGFPDNWTKYGVDDEEMSDTQRYKMMGNAVTTNIITAIGQKLLNQLTQDQEE